MGRTRVVGEDDLVRLGLLNASAEGQVGLVTGCGAHCQIACDAMQIKGRYWNCMRNRYGIADVHHRMKSWQCPVLAQPAQQRLAARLDRPMSHVAIAWLLARPGVASVLLGARTAEQLEGNLAAADLQLGSDDLAALTEASAPGLPPYPYRFLQDWSDVDTWWKLGT